MYRQVKDIAIKCTFVKGENMDIAAVSMEMSTSRIQQSASLSVAKKAMDNQEQQAAGLIAMMDQAVPVQAPGSGLGQVIDVRA